jgi:TfoX/Sxy family transcriptional regulator of competence genes
MATSKKYLESVSEKLKGLENFSYRSMMGEYALYYKGRVFDGIYDDRLLLKPTASAAKNMPGSRYEFPYTGQEK